ncbi:transcriptional regulator with XRE-family HTH domain [Haloactinospora alba]|uniref:Transcriptional regulator with XRE-family HTH domain n=1 Tax=Haloactinospora alba TaxID=405555 RepID=A0A543NHD1_9ACTN|nr:helix-turn-helix transcriptional regulator [Haloactinospora alba]TQN31258.1 transcriptional regulator with XRE-family HTH domain [Haloactinospora alba]
MNDHKDMNKIGNMTDRYDKIGKNMPYVGIRRRRLGRKLAELRRRANLNQTEVAAAFGWSQSSLARYERGERPPQRSLMPALFDMYEVPAQERDEVMTLYRLAESPNWWHPYRDLLRPEYAALIDLESYATTIRTYEVIIPGLFQTPEYTRQVLAHGPQEIDSEEVERRLELRTARQEILSQTERPRIIALMDEGALRRVVGDNTVMRDQIKHLLRLSEQARTTIQIVPYQAGSTPGAAGSFTLIDCEDTRVVYVETVAGELFLENTAEVDTCSQGFEQLLGFALSTNESSSLMRDYIKEYE